MFYFQQQCQYYVLHAAKRYLEVSRSSKLQKTSCLHLAFGSFICVLQHKLNTFAVIFVCLHPFVTLNLINNPPSFSSFLHCFVFLLPMVAEAL